VALLPLRLRLALASAIGTTKLIHAPDLIEDGAADAEARVPLEGDTAGRIEPVDRVDETDYRGGFQVVGVRDRADWHIHAARDPGGEWKVLLDDGAAGRCVAVA
jgi:hypothetical protein